VLRRELVEERPGLLLRGFALTHGWDANEIPIEEAL
jgi:hypothetical protein